jgi:hypothetical protein
MDIYHERQRGNLCRMHVLNAYFGYAKFNEQLFQELCKKFDNYLISFGYNLNCSSLDFDAIHSNQETIISFALKDCPTYFIYKAINEQINKQYFNDFCDFVFIFNQNHIFGLKKINNQWFKIDSLLNNVVLDDISNYLNYGMIIPRNTSQIDDDLKLYIDSIKIKFDEILLAKIMAIYELKRINTDVLFEYQTFLKKLEEREITYSNFETISINWINKF